MPAAKILRYSSRGLNPAVAVAGKRFFWESCGRGRGHAIRRGCGRGLTPQFGPPPRIGVSRAPRLRPQLSQTNLLPATQIGVSRAREAHVRLQIGAVDPAVRPRARLRSCGLRSRSRASDFRETRVRSRLRATPGGCGQARHTAIPQPYLTP